MEKEILERVAGFLENNNYSQDGAEVTFVTLGVHYGLSDGEIKSILKNKSVCDRHAMLLVRALKILDEWEKYEGDNQLDKLDHLLRKHYEPSTCSKEQYARLSELINNDDSLTAPQIYQLRRAVELKLPEKDILRMYRSGKEPLQMEKTIEYNVLIRDIEKKKNGLPKKLWARFAEWIKGVFKHGQ